jgi:hypothetical protein
MRNVLVLASVSLLSMTGAALATPPVPAPEIGGGVIGMSLVAGLAYVLKRGKQR